MADESDPARLTHLDAQGRAVMVDVSGKPATDRAAVASAVVRMKPETLRLLVEGNAKKGDVLAAARIAGIGAAKRTPELIPLCHHVALSRVEVRFSPDEATGALRIEARAQAHDRTGVEMEALTAASVAALTIYDMLKAVERSMTITDIRLESKSGGQRGDYERV